MPDNALFTQGRIGGVTIPNRIVLPSITTRLADADGRVTEATIAWYLARARGGVGLVTVEMAAPEPVGRHRARELGIHDDRFLPGLSRLTAALHAAGAKASIQLGHGGGHTTRAIAGATPIAPSAVPHDVLEGSYERVVPEAMSLERIEETIRAHVRAAARAKAAGFDLVELHGAHGYLISQFLCPAENLRGDSYGGSLANRARFGLDILRRIKALVPGLPVIFRLGVDDFFPGGLAFDEAREVARWIEEAGADALHVSAGHYRSLPSAARMIPPMALPEATFLDFAATLKAERALPVIAVGRLGDPLRASAAITQGKADFVALGRPLIADPDWPNKVRKRIPPKRCIACNTCVAEMRGGGRIGCLVNGRAGRESELPESTTIRGERIAVIGAGPAGLTFAHLVAEANHVTLFERSDAPGGALRQAARAPQFQEVEAAEGPIDAFIADLTAACRQAGVELRFGIAPTAADLVPFDRVVIATGAAYRFGLGPLARTLLATGLARKPPLAALFRRASLRDWFYHRARRAGGEAVRRALGPLPHVIVIGDALSAGKAKPAITSAFEAALAREPAASAPPHREEIPA